MTDSVMERVKRGLRFASEGFKAGVGFSLHPQAQTDVMSTADAAITNAMSGHRGTGDPPKRGTQELLTAYSTMPWLRAVTSKVGYAVASTEWELFAVKGPAGRSFQRSQKLQGGTNAERRKLLAALEKAHELVRVDQSPLLTLVNEANPFHSGLTARALLQNYWDLTGEWFMMLELNGLGVPVAWWPIPTHWVRETPRPGKPFYVIAFDATLEKEVPESWIIWAPDADPLNPYRRGSSLAGTLADELETAEFAAKHAKNFFFNRARPDFIAWVKAKQGEEPPSERQLRRLQEEWMAEHMGFWKSAKPHFTNREIDIHEFKGDMQSQQTIPIMEFERDTIVQVFGFPPEIFGILENSNRATIEAADFLFSSRAVVPRLEHMRSVWQQHLVPLFDDRLVLDFVSPVQEDAKQALEAAKDAPWAMDVDEYRARFLNAEPLPDEQGKVRPVPISMTFVTDLTEAAPIDIAPEEPKALSVPTWRKVYESAKKALDPAFVLVHRIADKLEPAMRRGFIRAMIGTRRKINLTKLTRLLAQGKVEQAIASLPWDVLEEQMGANVLPALKRTLAGVGPLAAQQLASQLGVDVGFDLGADNVRKWLKVNGAKLVKDTTKATRRGIAKLIEESIDNKETPTQLAKKIKGRIGLTKNQQSAVAKFEAKLRKDNVPEATIARRVQAQVDARLRLRARNIARTETIRAGNAGQQATWEQASSNGLMNKKKVKRRWVVTLDDRLDIDTCEPMEGQLVGLDTPFKTPQGQDVQIPPAHPMCRCVVALEFLGKSGEVIARIIPWTFYLAFEDMAA